MQDIIYYIPHQDDELVSFGVSIIHHVLKGHPVHLVFYTDGSATNTIRYFNGDVQCPWHGQNHDFQWDEQALVQARNREMAWSSMCLGVDPAQCYWRQHTKDGQFQRKQGVQLIQEFEEKFPRACHMVFTYKDPHPDHANMGNALLEMLTNRQVTHGRFYIKTSQLDTIDGVEVDCRPEFVPFLQAAQQVYRTFSPEAGLFAVGYHSVAATFDTQYDKPRSKYHF